MKLYYVLFESACIGEEEAGKEEEEDQKKRGLFPVTPPLLVKGEWRLGPLWTHDALPPLPLQQRLSDFYFSFFHCYENLQIERAEFTIVQILIPFNPCITRIRLLDLGSREVLI